MLCGNIAREVGPVYLGDVVDAALLRSRVFSNTENSPQAICCSSDTTGGGLGRSETLFNIAMTFENGKEPKGEVIFGRPGSGAETSVYNMPW